MFKRAVLPACFATTLLLASGLAKAGPNDILIGLDEKITYGPDGPINGSPGKDEVLVMDVTSPAKPVIRARLALMNSLLGPPTNLEITPDGKMALVASSVVNTPDASGFKVSPDERLFVVDLSGAAPKLTDTVTVGKQPSGLAISHKGDLVLIANRNGKSVSVLSITDDKVTMVSEVPVEQEAAAVAITPDGKKAFVCLNLANRVGVLNIDGQHVTYDKAMDIPVAFNPYNVDVTPNGKFAIVSTTGAGKNNADAMAVIDTSDPHPHTVGMIAPGSGPEGFTISPDGKWIAAALLLGSGARPNDWFKTKAGELALMSLDSNTGEMTVKARAPLGGLPDSLAFSPKSDFIYVGNYFDSELQVFNIQSGPSIKGGILKQVGPTIKLGGQPASMRGLAR
jgi:DNA-binding beta-propeller fold protein YncE